MNSHLEVAKMQFSAVNKKRLLWICVGCAITALVVVFLLWPHHRDWPSIEYVDHGVHVQATLKTRYEAGKLFYQLRMFPLRREGENIFDIFDAASISSQIPVIDFYDKDGFKVDSIAVAPLQMDDAQKNSYVSVAVDSVHRLGDISGKAVSWKIRTFEP